MCASLVSRNQPNVNVTKPYPRDYFNMHSWPLAWSRSSTKYCTCSKALSKVCNSSSPNFLTSVAPLAVGILSPWALQEYAHTIHNDTPLAQNPKYVVSTFSTARAAFSRSVSLGALEMDSRASFNHLWRLCVVKMLHVCLTVNVYTWKEHNRSVHTRSLVATIFENDEGWYVLAETTYCYFLCTVPHRSQIDYNLICIPAWPPVVSDEKNYTRNSGRWTG